MRLILPLRLLALLTLTAGALAPPAMAQGVDLNQPPVTKEDLARSDDNSASATDDGSGDVVLGLVIVGGLLLASASAYIVYDARDRTGGRADRVRPLSSSDVGKGAPKTMFTGEGAAGGQTGKRRKRVQGKRQRNARKANRPR